MKRALIAMSGGVDSSLAAKLIKDSGFDCIGCTMKLYDNDDIGLNRGHTCCSLSDVEDAKSVARNIDIPYYVFNFKEGFKDTVIANFVKAYEEGKTPNPCIECNRYMKFDKLYERAKALECDYVVTGHYARTEQEGDKYVLKKAVDENKDQSYVLYSMDQTQLSHTLLPLGGLTKSEVRDLASKYNFINANKPDSQDICFVPDGDYSAFLEKYTGKKYPCGNFKAEDGSILGTHNGIVHYTIGQRKGLGISFGKPLYVKAINPADNSVLLSEEERLYSKSLIATNFNWISGSAQAGAIKCNAKIRYRQKEQPATVYVIDEESVRIEFDTPVRAITPGQAAVLYDGDIVLGGGTITTVL